MCGDLANAPDLKGLSVSLDHDGDADITDLLGGLCHRATLRRNKKAIHHLIALHV